MADRPLGKILVDAAKGYRQFWDNNMALGIGLGFVPGVGTALAAVDLAAASIDPDATKLETTLAAAGIVPFGKGIGAVRKVVIGQEGATAAEKKLLKKAYEMFDAGPPKGVSHADHIDDIRKKTGWEVMPNGEWIRELNERGFTVARRESMPTTAGGGYEMPLPLATRGHPAVDRYKKLSEQTDLKYEGPNSLDEGGGYYDGGGLAGELTRASGKESRARVLVGGSAPSPQYVAAHEIQHGVQDAEGWGHPYLGDHLVSENVADWNRYITNPGEIMARVSATRRNWTDAQREKLPYMKHYWEEYDRVNAYVQKGTKAPIEPKYEEFSNIVKKYDLDPDELLLNDVLPGVHSAPAGRMAAMATQPSSGPLTRGRQRIVDPKEEMLRVDPAKVKEQEVIARMLERLKKDQAAGTAQTLANKKPTSY